jgi:ferrous-iron efflux pump FieF
MNAEQTEENAIEINPGIAMVAGWSSLITVTILIIVKTLAWLASGSTSVLASLTDSIVDASVSLMNFFAIRLSLKPADSEHRHGHGKVEGLAALLQGAFIFGAGMFLVFEAMFRFVNVQPVEGHWLAIGVMIFSTVASVALVAIQNYVLKRAPSLAVEADQAHYMSDIAVNGGVVVVLLVLKFGGPLWLDPVFALIVAAFLARTAWKIGVKAVDMLLDRELPDEMREEILNIAHSHKEIHAVHDLRTRKSGMQLYISFDVEIDPDMKLRDAHAVSLAVERAVLEKFPNAEIMIHKDPHGIPHDESRHNIIGIHDK